MWLLVLARRGGGELKALFTLLSLLYNFIYGKLNYDKSYGPAYFENTLKSYLLFYFLFDVAEFYWARLELRDI